MNLWKNEKIKKEILDLYFNEQKTSNQIFKTLLSKYNLNMSNTQIKKDIGRIIHRRSEDLKLNRINEKIGNCPICGREVFLRDRTKANEKYSCICSGVYENKCYFRLTKNAYGIPLYNSIIKQLLQNKKTKIIKNMKYKDQIITGYLELDKNQSGFINIKKIKNF